ncbi:hypothetical protein [Yersinia aleksiciae]|nr:hypothetical protein [Yersinia aleksiciae]
MLDILFWVKRRDVRISDAPLSCLLYTNEDNEVSLSY